MEPGVVGAALREAHQPQGSPGALQLKAKQQEQVINIQAAILAVSAIHLHPHTFHRNPAKEDLLELLPTSQVTQAGLLCWALASVPEQPQKAVYFWVPLKRV